MQTATIALEIKAVSDDARRIEGWATRPEEDRVGDVVIPRGAIYSLPIPFLLDHDHTRSVGEVDKVEVTDQGIKFWATIAKIEEPGEAKDLCDTAWSLIKHGLRKAVSIGFRAKDFDLLPTGGLKFTKWEWLELSAVTVPALASARITSVKSLDGNDRFVTAADDPKSIDTDTRAALGIRDGDGRPVPPGASGKTTTHKTIDLRPKEAKTMTISEQIAALEAKRAANTARQEAIAAKAAADARTMDAEEGEEFDTLTAENATIDKDLARYKAMEKAKATTATPVTGVRSVETGADARLPAQVKMRKQLPPGIGFARFARVKGLAGMTGQDPLRIAKNLYGEDSDTFGIFEKAAVAAGTTAGWGSFLVGDETGVFADFAEYLRPQTILGRFGNNGIPGLRSVPFRTPLLSQTGAATGYWVGEGRGKPVTSMAGGRTTLTPMKAATIAVVTEELLRDSSPSAEALLRDELAAAIRERLDTDFIDPAKAAVTNVSPASITNGVTPIASGGNTADDVRGDIQSLMEAFIADNNAPTTAVFVMPATIALALSLMKNPLGQTEFPGISINGGTLEGIPVITSEYVPTVTGGSYVALINASDVYVADEGEVMVDMSREASLQMDNSPTMSSDTPTGTTVVSMWQTNSVAFRAERTINWARRRTSGVQLLSGVNWTSVPA